MAKQNSKRVRRKARSHVADSQWRGSTTKAEIPSTAADGGLDGKNSAKLLLKGLSGKSRFEGTTRSAGNTAVLKAKKVSSSKTGIGSTKSKRRGAHRVVGEAAGDHDDDDSNDDDVMSDDDPVSDAADDAVNAQLDENDPSLPLEKRRSLMLRRQRKEKMGLKHHIRELKEQKSRLRGNKHDDIKSERKQLGKYITSLSAEQGAKHTAELAALEHAISTESQRGALRGFAGSRGIRKAVYHENDDDPNMTEAQLKNLFSDLL